MKFTALFLVLVMVTTVYTMNNKYDINFASKRNLHNVLAEVKAKLASGAPLSDIMDLLNEIKEEILAEQKNVNEIAKVQAEECATEVKFRTKEVSDGQSANQAAKSAKATCESEKKTAEANLVQNLAEQEFNRNKIAKLNSDRAKARSRLASAQSSHYDAKKAVVFCLDTLEKIFSGEPTLIQLRQVSLQLLQSGVKLKMSRHFSPILGVLAQIASRKIFANEESLKKVKQMLEDLGAEIEKSLKLYNEQDERDEALYQKVLGQLTDTKNALEEQEKDLRKEIAENEKCISIQTARIASSAAKVLRNGKLLEVAKDMCQDFKQEKEAGDKSRAEELKVIASLGAIVKKKFDELTENTGKVFNSRLDADVWDVYENHYEHKAAEMNELTTTEYSEEGAEQAGFKRTEKLEGFLQK